MLGSGVWSCSGQGGGEGGHAILYQDASIEVQRSQAGDEVPSTAAPVSGEAHQPDIVDLSVIAGAWKEIRRALKRTHPAVDGLLNSCKPVEVRGEELVLGFQSEAVRAIMEKPDNVEAAGRAIAAVTGRSVRLRCVVINARGKAPPDIAQDGMMATALNQGGEIVDMQE